MRFLATLLLVGCSGSNPDPQQHFLGTWQFSTGTDNVSCPNGNTADKLTGTITVKDATSGGLLVLDAEGCNFNYEVTGEAANLSGTKTCSFAVPQLGQGVTADLTYAAITLSTTDGKLMNDTFNGTVVYNAPSGKLDCTFSGSATLDKVSGQ